MRLPLVAASLLGVALLGQSADAAFVVVPNANANAPGDASAIAPFNYHGTSGSRDQLLYPASQFGVTPELLTGISFRPTPGGSISAFTGGTITISNAVVQLSTTSATESALSATYATNVGANVATVYSGAITLTTADTTTGSTRAFDYTLTFQTPFAYNPSLGNLLLDVTIPTGATVGGTGFGPLQFDDVNDNGDGVASVVNLSSGSPTTGTVGTDAPIAQFAYTAVPEPASLIGLLIGAGGLLKRSRRQSA